MEVEAQDKKMHIVVNEYPKSGGSWLTSLLGDALDFKKRDIYITSHNTVPYRIQEHPWYRDFTSFSLPAKAVIKCHEPPESHLLPKNATIVHLVRDGRDVCISKYYFEKNFLVQNGYTEKFATPFDVYLENIASEWSTFVSRWTPENVLTVRYEDLLHDTTSTVSKVIEQLPVSATPHKIREAVRLNTKKEIHESLDRVNRVNTFVRKGIAGDWKNHFTDQHHQAFQQIAGNAMKTFGYILTTCNDFSTLPSTNPAASGLATC